MKMYCFNQFNLFVVGKIKKKSFWNKLTKAAFIWIKH